MNTKHVQEQLQGLKAADLAAYRAGQKSNYIVSYLRNEFIKRAAKEDISLQKEIEVKFSMTAASYAIAAIALLSKEGNYPALFTKADMRFENGEIILTYLINEKGLSNEYREKLNEQLDINLPVLA